jgi:hypothetical protein
LVLGKNQVASLLFSASIKAPSWPYCGKLMK